MKLEPFLMTAAFGLTGYGTVLSGDPYPYEFLAAVSSGTTIALCISYWKSRQRKADGIDTALWAMIAVFGSWTLAFLGAPTLMHKTVPVIDLTLTKPLAGFLIAVAAPPFIEWIGLGEAWKTVRKLIDKWVDRDKP